ASLLPSSLHATRPKLHEMMKAALTERRNAVFMVSPPLEDVCTTPRSTSVAASAGLRTRGSSSRRRFPARGEPVHLTAFVATHRCGGSPGLTPDSLLRRSPCERTESTASLQSRSAAVNIEL